MTYDTIIIGAGPAGMTAATYLGRYQRSVLLITGDVGGQTAIAGSLENFPSYQEINGFELATKMMEQTRSQKTVETVEGERVSAIEKNEELFEIKSDKNAYTAKTVLITAGKKHRELNLPNEKSLIGKGLSYCATCDGAFAKDKDIAIIGGGYAATEAALILKNIASSVVMLNLGEKLSCETVTLEQVGNNTNIKIINNALVKAIDQDESGFISGIQYLDQKSGETKSVESKMVFVEIGQIPNTEAFKDTVALNESGEIIIDRNNRTDKEGIFAAGDITDIPAKQTVVACGEGAKAAIAINAFLEKKN